MNNNWYKKIKAYDFSDYENIGLDHLTAFSVKCLNENNIEPLFENIVVVLFKMFPKRFSLVNFEEYPDSNRVNRQILHCRPQYRNYLAGGMRRGWVLTNKGKDIAEETKQMLENPSLTINKKRVGIPRERTKSLHFINEIVTSEAYKKFKSKKHEKISELELCDVIHANLDTPTTIIAQSIERLSSYAKIVDNADVIEFLKFIKQQLVKNV